LCVFRSVFCIFRRFFCQRDFFSKFVLRPDSIGAAALSMWDCRRCVRDWWPLLGVGWFVVVVTVWPWLVCGWFVDSIGAAGSWIGGRVRL